MRCVEAVMLDVEGRKEAEAGFAFVKTGMIMLEQGYSENVKVEREGKFLW